MPNPNLHFSSIDAETLTRVFGGASRVTSRSSGSSEQITQMLTSLTSQIKDLAANKSGGMDSMMPMMMMMMMGGGGGGGGGQVAAAPPPPAAPPPRPVVSITNSISRA